MFSNSSILAQVIQQPKPAVDSTGQEFKVLENELKSVKANTTAIMEGLKDIQIPGKAPCIPVLDNQITGAEWVLILFPAIFFVVALFILFHKTKEFNFKEALKENDVSTITVVNPYYSGQVTDPGKTDVPLSLEVTPNVVIIANSLNSQAQLTQTPEAQTQSTLYNMDYKLSSEVYRASISRYIALISSFLIIIIAVTVCCFFLYHYLKFGCPPELGALSSVMLALGVGIVPYVANKISFGIKSNKSES